MTRATFLIVLIVMLLGAACAKKSPSHDDASANMVEANVEDVFANASEEDFNASDTGVPDGSVLNQPDRPPPAPSGPVGAAIEKGKGAFVQPGDMEVGHWHRVEFALGPTKKAVLSQVEDHALGPVADISLTPSMRVTLHPDQNFEVRPIGNPVKSLGLDKAASWQWDVRPVSDGSHELVAYVEILRERPDGSFQPLDDYTKRVSINVKVGTWQGFLSALKDAQSLGDALGTLFRSWEKTLLALAALITAGFILVRTVAKRGAA